MTSYELDQADARARRRKRVKLVLFSLPVIIFAMFVAVKLMGLSITTQSAILSYNVGDYPSSIDKSTSLLELNIVEPWIPYFNRGDAQAANEYYVDSVDDFEKALELAPEEKKCDVRVNLALSWEKLGDIYADGGYFQGAVLLYETAEAVIDGGGEDCKPPQESEEQLQEAGERVEGKKDSAQSQKDAQDAQEGGEGTLDEKLQDLKDQGEQGEGEKANGESLDRGENEGDGTFADKPW